MEWDYLLNKKFQISNAIRDLNLSNNEYILLVSGSYGDIFPNLALLPVFYELKKSNINIFIDKRYEILAQRFNYPFVKYFYIDNEIFFRQSLFNEASPFILQKGRIYPLLPTLHPLIAEACLTERFSDYEMKRLILGLPKGAPMVLPPSSNYESRITNIFNNLNLPKNNTVILSFFSNSNPIIPFEVQKTIAEIIINKNFSVVFNVAESFRDSPRFNYSGFKTIEIPADIPVEFVNFAGRLIGSVSGLLAILTTFGCNGKILNLVDKTHDFIPNNGMLIRSESTSLYTVLSEEINCDHLEEIRFTNNNISFLLQEINNWLSN